MIYLWKYTGKELELNLKEILMYQDLAIIYNRDSSRDKFTAKLEFKYIHFLADRDSYCIKQGLSDKEAKEFALKNTGLTEAIVNDKYLLKAISKVRELNGGVIENLIDATVSAFRIDANLMVKVKELLEDMESKLSDIDSVTNIMKMTDAIVNMSNVIPTKINALLDLREQYDKAQSKVTNEKRGGGKIGNSLDGTGIEQYTDTGQAERLD